MVTCGTTPDPMRAYYEFVKTRPPSQTKESQRKIMVHETEKAPRRQTSSQQAGHPYRRTFCRHGRPCYLLAPHDAATLT